LPVTVTENLVKTIYSSNDLLILLIKFAQGNSIFDAPAGSDPKPNKINGNMITYLKKVIASDIFTHSTAEEYENIFTPQEIEQLLEIHQTPVMKKFNDNRSFLLRTLIKIVERELGKETGKISVWRTSTGKLRVTHVASESVDQFNHL